MGRKTKKLQITGSPTQEEINVQQNLVERMNNSLQKTVSSFSSRLSYIRHLLSKI